MKGNNPPPYRLAGINWQTWEPDQTAVLLFVVRDEQVLLIHKKQGLGAGKINAPGGRIEPGETPRQAAVRETQEELCITPHDPRFAGDLFFQFTDGLALRGYVFRTHNFTGTPTETDEAIPIWAPVTQVPYHRMWADDRLWIPHLLSGTRFQGYFIFDDDEMLEHRLVMG